jgi:peroxiredoxin
LDFPLGTVSAVRFPTRAERPRPPGPYCFELEGGDVLFGALVGLSAQKAELDVPGLGLLHVQRSALQRILQWRGGADLVYAGPNGLSEWKESSPGGGWRQESGQLFTARDGASLIGDLGIPAQACIEFELSWTDLLSRTLTPDFVFAMGARGEQDEQAFRLEVWDRQLVLLRETAERADLASLQETTSGAGCCHFRVYLDQEHSRAVVLAADGRLLANLAVPDAHPRPGPCLRLVNHHGTLRLERLYITRWNGESPCEVQAGKSRLHRSDGSTVYGEIRGFDASAREFLVAQDGRETKIGADAVESVVLSPSAGPPSCDIRAVFQDGARLSGNLCKVEKGRLWLSRPGIAEPLGVRATDLQTLVALDGRKPPLDAGGRDGQLETDSVKLHGCLVEGGEQAGASCLVWHPRGSSTASPLKHGLSGRIVYRESSPPPPSPRLETPVRAVRPQVARGRRVVVVENLFGRVIRRNGVVATTDEPSNADSSSGSRRHGPALYLRTGDTIPCEVKRIDGRGLTFHSSLVNVTFVTHDKVKAVELENQSRATKIDGSKRDRLLTLPRMQKDDPPTHLIRSTEGDYLRARLIELDDKTLTVEVRLETRHLPRDHIARIIWLDADEARPKPKASNAKLSGVSRVQVFRDDGIRLTFCAEKLTGTILQGTSDVLGACRVELGQVDQVLLGEAIERAAQTLPYQRWKLRPAVQPKIASSAGQGGDSGTESALVGKPAPDFELETLDGQRFRLSDHRGKIVVLDFWATWCGPCMQTLPQVVRAVKECQNRNVMLVAVNLQESPKAITAMLERLKLETTVALDRNGVVAQQYAAVAIPQTAIIDGQGNVARLFVGGGPQYVDQLRGALQAAVTTTTGQGTSR